MCVCVCVCVGTHSVAQSCPTLWDTVDCSPLGSSVHGIFQARILGVGCYFLLQGTFSTKGSNPHILCLLHWQADSLLLSHLGSPESIMQRHKFTQSLGILLFISKINFRTYISCTCWLVAFLNGCSKQWRRQWHPTPVVLPGKSHGRRSLVGCSPWGH